MSLNTCSFLLADLAGRKVVYGWGNRWKIPTFKPRLPDPPMDKTYLYSSLPLDWFAAKLFCECHGSLAVLDTEAEFKAFRKSV